MTDGALSPDARLRQLELYAEYMRHAAKHVEWARVVDLFARYAGEDGREMAMSVGDKLLAQGRSEGRASMLLKLLTLRFGVPSDATIRRVNGASESELELWAERILTAASVEDVLDG